MVSTRGVRLAGADRHTISTTTLSPWTTAPLDFEEQCGPGGQVRRRPHPASSRWEDASRSPPPGSGELSCNTTELASPTTDGISHQGALSLP
jgi:hypothetical protein